MISGVGALTKSGSGVLVLGGVNTFTNTATISAGTLRLAASERLSDLAMVHLTASSATFDLAGFTETIGAISGAAGKVTLGAGALIAGGSDRSTTNTAVISGTGTFTKTGLGTLILSGANTYTGATAINGGAIQLSASSRLPAASAVTVNAAGLLNLTNFNQTVASLSGSGAVALGSGTLTTATAGSATFSGAISGTGGLTKTGAGTQILSGVSSFNGATTVSAGSLQVNGSSPSSAVAVNAAATLSGGGTVGNVTVNSTGTLSPGASGPGTITASTVTWAGGGTNTVEINSATGSKGANPGWDWLSGGSLTINATSSSQYTIRIVSLNLASAAGLVTGFDNTATYVWTIATFTNGITGFDPLKFTLNTNAFQNPPGAGSFSITQNGNDLNLVFTSAPLTAVKAVQSGVLTSAGAGVSAVTLGTAVNPAKAFLLFNTRHDSVSPSGSMLRGRIASATSLEFTRVSGTTPIDIQWYVVEYSSGVIVQRGDVSQTGTVVDVPITPLSATNQAFVTWSKTPDPSGSGTAIGARMLRAQIIDASTLQFDRGIAGAPDDISEIVWQAVELKDGTQVQRGTVNFPTGAAEETVSILPLNTTRSAAFSAVQPAGGQNTGRSTLASGGSWGVASATLALPSPSQLVLDRDNTAADADIGWFVVGFGPGNYLIPASGGSAISADTAGGAYTALTGPAYTEIQSGNVGTGTIILTAPTGFVFDTAGTAPTVLVTRVGGSGANTLNINGAASGVALAMTSVTASTITFTVTTASSGGVTCSLTWQNLRVRPTAGTPLASGNILRSGTSTIQGLTAATSFGVLAEVPGAASKLALQTTPSSTAVAGVDFTQQPVIAVQDQFGNVRTSDNTTVVTATRAAGTSALDGVTVVTAQSGLAAFSGLDYLKAETITISFTSPGLTSKTSGNIVVSPAAASQVTVLAQPSAAATAGIAFAQQPSVRIEDTYGNLRSTDSSTVVTASISQGTDDLFGTQTATAVNGVATFSNLSYQTAETITLEFDAGALDSDFSSPIVVGPAAASQLVLISQPSSTATAGTAFAQQPVVAIQDAFGNLRTADNSSLVTASRNSGSGSGALQGLTTVTASGGLASFANLSHNVAGTISLDFASGALAGTTSSSILVSPAAASALAFATQPGSATVGSVFGAQPVVVTRDAFGNNSTVGLSAAKTVSLALTAGTGPLQGTTTADIGSAAGNGSVSFSNLRIDAAGSGKQLTASALGFASAVSSAFAVAQGPQTITFGALGAKQYGDAAFAVSASSSSGLTVSFSIVSGPATVSGSLVTITGAGAVTVRASQAGSADYLAATPVDQSFAVAKAPLAVTANNASRVYGAPDPTFSAAYSGFVNGDTVAALSGSPAFAVASTATSPVGAYAITPSLGTLASANYSFGVFNNGTLTIAKASSANAVSTSANPSPTGASLTLTAALSAVAPGTGTPSGSVQFRADGSALGSVTVVGGSASLATTALSHGSHVITAEYAGDARFLGSTNTLAASQVINAAPVAGSDAVSRYPGSSLKVLVSALLANDSDPESDAISFASVAASSAAGGTVSRVGKWVFYQPPTGLAGGDSFTYSISDSGGLTATGTVSISVLVDLAQSQNLVATTDLGNGSFRSRFQGIPGRVYTIQYSLSPGGAAWQTLGTGTADAAGSFEYLDTPPNGSAARYYRAIYP